MKGITHIWTPELLARFAWLRRLAPALEPETPAEQPDLEAEWERRGQRASLQTSGKGGLRAS